MKRPVKLGIASLKALGIVVALGAAAHASLPYLPLIGPPPLRVQAVRSPVAIAETKVADVAVSNNPVAVTQTNKASTTNAETSGVADNAVAPAATLAVPSADPTVEDAFTGSVFAMPTPDLLGITPQMLATYFHPVQFGTNAVLTGPFRVSFLPPLPPEKSSHADYIIK